jgi:hypothetical protein
MSGEVNVTETCMACNIDRKAVAGEPLTDWYEVVFYRCPSCKTILRLLERKRDGGKAGRLNGNRKPKR